MFCVFNTSYVIESGICYLTLTDRGYNKRLAFLFLEEISREFVNYLTMEHGDEWQKVVDTVGRQYAFIKFDQTIQKKRREYSDPNSSANMRRLNDDLASIHNVMRGDWFVGNGEWPHENKNAIVIHLIYIERESAFYLLLITQFFGRQYTSV